VNTELNDEVSFGFESRSDSKTGFQIDIDQSIKLFAIFGCWQVILRPRHRMLLMEYVILKRNAVKSRIWESFSFVSTL
jgi:hypothetical protein